MIRAFGKYITIEKVDSDKEYSTGIVSKQSHANLIVKGKIISIGSHKDFFNDKKPILKKGMIVYVHEFPKDKFPDIKANKEIAFVRSDTIYGYED